MRPGIPFIRSVRRKTKRSLIPQLTIASLKTDAQRTRVDSTPSKSLTSQFRTWLGVLGPGMITAALVFGPSKVTITSKLGADYGFALLWIIVVAIFFMVVFTAMAARIGMASDESFLTLIRKKW